MEDTINKAVEGTLAKYLEFKAFEIFKKSMVEAIRPHCRENSVEDVYQHLFLCPANLSKKRNFQLHGVLSPFVCFWRTSALSWNKKLYGRSVLPRDFEYEGEDGTIKCERGFLYDITFKMDLFSSSYYKSFRDRVNQNLLDFDRLRYFTIDVKELLTGCAKKTTRAELMLKDFRTDDKPGDEKENRSFDLTASYDVSVTVPYCRSFDFIERMEIYLNENKIYERDYTTVNS